MTIDLDSYTPSDIQKKQLEILFKIVNAALNAKVPLYITGGYGLDALYGKLTRDHRDIDIFIKSKGESWLKNFLLKLDFKETGVSIGEVGKKEFINENFSKEFTIEYGLLENAQNLVKKVDSKLDYADWFPGNPIGILDGVKIPVPTFRAFEVSIMINNSPIAKNTEPYRNQEWLDAIMKVLKTKHT